MTNEWDPIWLERFAAQATFPAEALAGVPAEQLDARLVEGKSSIRELVVHCVDADLVGGWRLRRVIAEPGPSFWAYDENAFLARLSPATRSLERLAELFRLHRLDLHAILSALTPDDFARTGTHSENGPMSLGQLVRVYVEHIESHRRHLNLKRTMLGLEPTREMTW